MRLIRLNRFLVWPFLVLLLSTLFLGALFVNPTNVQAATVTWDGGGADGTCGGGAGDGNKWSCASNWTGDALPQAADTALFNATSTKNVTVDANVSITSINMAAGYTGQMTISAGVTITLTSTMTIAAGTVDLNGRNIDTVTFSKTAGTVSDTAEGGKINISGSTTVSGGSWTEGELVLDGTSTQAWAGSGNLYDLTLNNTAEPGLSVASTYTPNITHNFTHSDGSFPANFQPNVDGNFIVGASATTGAGTVTLDGTGPQELNNLGGYTSNLKINKANDTATVNPASAAFRIYGGATFTMTAGNFDLNGRTVMTGDTGTLSVGGGTLNLNGGTMDVGIFTQTAGTVSDTAGTGQITVSGTTTGTSGAWTSGKLVFDGNNVSQNWSSASGGTAWYDVIVNKTGATDTLTNTSTVNPNITHNLTLTDGSILVNIKPYVDGNVSVGASFSGGAGYIYLDGTGSQEISVTAGGVVPGYLYINKATGVANMASASIDLVVPTRLDITQGIFNANGKNITVTANTFSNTGTLQVQGSETLTFTKDTNSGIVEYIGDGAATTYNSLNYGNTYWNATFNSTSGTNTWKEAAGATVTNDLTITKGAFDANDQTLSIQGNTFINGGTMMTGTNVNTFGNAAADSITISSGELKIESDNTTTDIVKNASSVWTNSGGTINYNAGSVISQPLRSDLSPYYNLTVDSAGSTYTLNGNIVVSNDSNIVAGTVDASATNYTIYIAGDWSNTGTFTARNGLVYFVGADSSTQEINGTTSFYNFRARTSGNTLGRTFQFAGLSTTTVTGTWQIFGYNGKMITLKSSDANAWTIIPATADVSYVDVTRSTNSGVAFCARDSIDSNFNTNWNFACLGAGITVSGTIYTAEDKLTNIGPGRTIGLSVAGNSKTTVTSGAGGTFSFTGVQLAANDPLSIFIDNTPPGATPTPWAQTFSDVDPSYWAYNEIEYLNSLGWMTGYGGGIFGPEDFAPRQQVAAAIARAYSGSTQTEDKIPAGPGIPTFVDVPLDNVFYDEIEYANAQGIMTGYPDGTFRPTADARIDPPPYAAEYATRATMGPVLARAKGLSTPEPSSLSFVDVQSDPGNPNYEPYYKEIEAIHEAGYTTGCHTDPNPDPPPDDLVYFCPDDNLTRASLAVFIARAYPNPDNTNAGTLVTQANDNVTNITGLEMYNNKVVIRHETAGPINNDLLAQAKPSGETDAHYTTSYSPYQENIDFDDGFEVYIDSGKTYIPGGTVEADDFDIRGTFNPEANNVTLHGSYNNNGTFTAGTTTVTFDSTAAGETLSGTMNGTSSFYKVTFNRVGGSWIIQDAILVSAANATDTFVIGNGTVTLGDGSGDNLEIDGKMTIAAMADQTGTFQTTALSEGSSIVLQVNNDTATTCPNCIISVGANSGTGQGNLKIRKNTIVKLIPRNIATGDTGIETETTGYLEIQGSLDYTGTSDGATDETTMTDSGKAWALDENNGKVVRITNTDSLAFGKIYDITDTTATTLVRADNSTITETSPTVSGSGPTRILTLTTQNGIIVANNDHIGRYIHNLVDDTYYKIVDSAQVGVGTDTITIIAEPAADFTQMDTNDDIEVTDGVRANDTYEVLDYATVRAENDTCAAAVGGAGEAYIYSKAGSENIIKYADICNLGRNVANKYGLSFYSVNGANSGEGVTVDKSKVRSGNYGIYLNGSSNNSTANSKGILSNSVFSNTNRGIYLSSSSNNTVSSNTAYSITNSGIYLDSSSDNNTVSSNTAHNSTNYGIYLNSSKNNTVSSNTAYNNTDGIYIYLSSNNNTVSANTAYGNTSGIILLSSSKNNTISSNSTYSNTYGIYLLSLSSNNTLFANNSYSNTNGIGFSDASSDNTLFANNSYSNGIGLYVTSTASTGNILINENYGSVGANTTADVSFDARAHNLRLYNTTLASATEVTGVTTANAYVASFNHDGAAGSTKIWNDYVFATDSTETPQDETTNKFNYADNSWEKSATPHGYSGTGTEDTNLSYNLSTASLGSGPYSYKVTANTAGVGASCITSQAVFDVFRNGIDTGLDATSGTQFTDTNGGVNVKFTIDCGATPYAIGATYTFTTWDVSNDTNTARSVTMMQDSDTFTVASGKILQSIGDAAHKTVWTKGGGAGTGYNILGAGTFNINYSTFDYLKGVSGIDVQAGATVTDLSNTAFDNLISAGAADTYINVASTVIGTGLKTFSSDVFNNTGATAEFNVNRTGSDDVGTWWFPTATGALAGEAFDAKAGVNEADPGMITWDDSSPTISIGGTCKKYDQTTNCADGETIKIAINGVLSGSTSTTLTGAWSIAGVTPASGDTITVWVDGVADGLEANAVTKYDGSGNIYNVALYEEHLTIGSSDSIAVTNADLDKYDNSNSGPNEDIFFDVNDATNDLTVDATAQSTQEELYVYSGATYRPNSASSGNTTTHDLENTGTMQMDGNTIYMDGSWLNSGTFTANTSTVEFNAAAGTETINMGGTGTGKAFYNLLKSTGGTLQALTNGIDVDNDLTISASTILSANNLAVYIGGSYSNSGTFTAGTGTVTFDSTAAGKTLSGRLNNAVTTSAFYKVAFNSVGGFWTINDPMYVTAANATDTLVIGNGTVTLGDGNGDNLEVDGKFTIAAIDGQTGTFQTTALAEGSSIVLQVNKDTATTCANCIINVGATSGAGQGNLKIRKNTIVKLIPRNIAGGDTGINAQSTGYLEIQGSQDYAGTSDGVTDETTITDSGKAWALDENNGKVVRVTNTSSLAFGHIYDITDTTATTLVRADNSSVTETSPTVSGSGSTRTLTLTTQNGIVVANNDHINRYVHNIVDDTYYKIVDSVPAGAGLDTLTIIAEPSADFSQMNTNDDIEVTDGVRANDTYEILDYAKVQAESDTCAATVNQSGEAYIYAYGGSENVIRYADICNLGRNPGAFPVYGIYFDDIDGSNSNEGVTVSKSKIYNSYLGIYLDTSPNNNSGSGKGIVNNSISGQTTNSINLNSWSNNNTVSYNILSNDYHGIALGNNSNNNTLEYNSISETTLDGISLSGSTGNTLNNNTVFNYGSSSPSSGIEINQSRNNILTSNQVFGKSVNAGSAIELSDSDNCTLTSNKTYVNDWPAQGIELYNSNNNRLLSNISYANISGFYISAYSDNNFYYNNQSYENTFGLELLLLSSNNNNTFYLNQIHDNTSYGIYAHTADDSNNIMDSNQIYSNNYGYYSGGANTNLSINDNYGGSGANTTADIGFAAVAANLQLYNTTLASTETAGVTTSGAYVVSRKHDGVAGSTKIWNDYAFATDSSETPQDETTNKFNYADNSWANSFSPHAYNVGMGAGTEDTNLDYGINGSFGGDGSVYNYFISCAVTTCSTGTADAWNVYRNGTLLTNKAVTGTTYTDSQVDGGSAPNIQFKIDEGAIAHTQGATYTFTAWKASGDTNTTKSVTMVQDGDTYAVGSGQTLQSIGDATHRTAWTKGGGAGTGYNILGTGTFNINYSNFDYLKGPAGLDIQAGSTVTDLSNINFDNLINSATDAFIQVASSVIGAVEKIITGVVFNNTGGGADINVNRTGSDDVGYWRFSGSSGALSGEAFDGKNGVDEADPGMLQWDSSAMPPQPAPSGFSGTVISSSEIDWSWTDNSTNEDNYRVVDGAGGNVSALLPASTGSWNETTGLSPNTSYTRKARAINAYGSADSGTATKTTFANVPGAPTVNATSTSSLAVIINENSNPAGTEYAIWNDTASKYVKADGTLGNTAVWQDYTAWGGGGGLANTGLAESTAYTYTIKARNANNIETAFSGGTVQTTLVAGGDPVPTPTPTPTLAPIPTPTPTAPVIAQATPTPEESATFEPTPGPATSPSVEPAPGEQVGEKSIIAALVSNIKDFFTDPKTKENTKILIEASAPALAVTSTAVFATYLVVTVLNLGNLIAFLISLFNIFLELIGLKKKRRPWGVVYDASTKSPVFLAIVRIYNRENKLIETRVTDRQGRFGFLVDTGIYRIMVTKNGYNFTSQIVKLGTQVDDIFSNLYHGEVFEITPQKGVIETDIPVDPITITDPQKISFDNFVKTVRNAIYRFLPFFMLISLVIVMANYIFITKKSTDLIYAFVLVMLLIKQLYDRSMRAKWGIVYDTKTKLPVAGAIVRIVDQKYNKIKETKISDSQGRYGFLATAGEYNLQVLKPGYKFPSSIVINKNDHGYSNVYHGEKIVKPTDDSIVSQDIAIDPDDGSIEN